MKIMKVTPDSGPKEYPVRPALAVGAVVFKDNRVLLVKRGNSPGRGVWQSREAVANWEKPFKRRLKGKFLRKPE